MKWLLLTISLLISGCANIPTAIQNPPDYDISYTQAIQSINSFKGAPVRWGGLIVDVQNEQTFSQLQILYYPLNSYGRPVLESTPSGRFVVRSPTLFDPAIYTKNLEITLAGTLVGDIDVTIDRKTLKLPQVSATTIQLWQPRDQSYGYYDRFSGAGRFGGVGYNSFYGYPYYPPGSYYGQYPNYGPIIRGR